MNDSPAIVIVGYNRPNSLRRLLSSITQATYPHQEIPLHISIDKSDTSEVAEIAQEFEWKWGKKTVSVQPKQLGLKSHVLHCGDLTKKYGSIILLEDDVFVAPAFYHFAVHALTYYQDEPKIAGVSLYAYELTEVENHPFKPTTNNADVYFMQLAGSWGQVWSRSQWSAFREWFDAPTSIRSLPKYIQSWGENSWKKHFIQFLISTNRFFVFPRESYSTNFEDFGTNASTSSLFQSTLNGKGSTLVFQPLANSSSIYDAWFEPLPQVFKKQSKLKNYAFSVDLFGTKTEEEIDAPFVLTAREGVNPIFQFSSTLKPIEINVKYGVSGTELGLYAVEDVNFSMAPDIRNYFSEDHLRILNKQKKRVSLSVIIPISSNTQNSEIRQSVLSIQKLTGTTECIIVGATDQIDRIQKSGVTNGTLDCKFVINNQKESFNKAMHGFQHARQEIVTYLIPGGVLDLSASEKLHQIFSTFGYVHWIVCASKNEENVSKLRFNSATLNYFGAFLSGDLMFWRKDNGILQIDPKMHESAWFRTALEKEALYTVAHSLGTNKSVMKVSAFQSPSLLKRVRYKWFLRNKTQLRNWHPNNEYLPNVIRYNKKQNNFYPARF